MNQPPSGATPATRATIMIVLPIMLVLWLLPLLGVAMTSVRPSGDLAAGNYFGIPSRFAWENYADVFRNSPLAQYLWNIFRITIPVMIGAVGLSVAGTAAVTGAGSAVAAGAHGGRDQGFRGHAPAESARGGFDETGGGGQVV